MRRLRLPIGISSFEKIRKQESYYVDKTRIIEDLADESFDVMLFTRPRRFGKTLLMQTLTSFFDIRRDSASLFKGLYISQNESLCEKWMNKFPVLSLSLKDVCGENFEIAYGRYRGLVSDICKENKFLLDSNKTDDDDKALIRKYIHKTATEAEECDFLFQVTRMLSVHYQKPTVLIVDEYDVPLSKADEAGYYDEMIDFVRGLFSKSIKDNPHLEFAIITGCLRVAHESIFTGANNFLCDTISDVKYSSYFGFTEREVDKILSDADAEDYRKTIKKWYDGYTFGKSDIYCPWDVLNCVRDLYDEPNRPPKAYWKNTSHNSVIRRFIERGDLGIGDKFETLMSGGSIRVRPVENLSYDILHSDEDNLWSMLYMTGYLTMSKDRRDMAGNTLELVIPNEEVKTIYEETISRWYKDSMRAADNSDIFAAFVSGDTKLLSARLSELLLNTISYYDYDENYYHAFLAGLFAGKGFAVESNREHGTGRPDIVASSRRTATAIIIEVKHTRDYDKMEELADEAIAQIRVRKYAEGISRSYKTKLCYGAVFCDKECLIVGTDR